MSFFLIGYFGMWKDTMSTMAIISVATLICLFIGTPIGILMARSERLKNILSISENKFHRTKFLILISFFIFLYYKRQKRF